MRQNQKTATVLTLRAAFIAAVDHCFNEHKGCSETWCKAKIAAKEGKIHAPSHYPKGRYFPKDGTHHKTAKDLLAKATTDYKLQQCLHDLDTQCCEAFQKHQTQFLPKELAYLSLQYVCRAYLGVGTWNAKEAFYATVLEGLGIQPEGHCLEALTYIETTNADLAERKKTYEAVKRRAYKQKAMSQKDMQERDFYSPGAFADICNCNTRQTRWRRRGW